MFAKNFKSQLSDKLISLSASDIDELNEHIYRRSFEYYLVVGY